MSPVVKDFSVFVEVDEDVEGVLEEEQALAGTDVLEGLEGWTGGGEEEADAGAIGESQTDDEDCGSCAFVEGPDYDCCSLVVII